MARSPLLTYLLWALRDKSHPADTRPPVGWTRRGFLLTASAALPLAYPQLRPAATAPRIAIIGAGIAGLNAAWYLKRAGLSSNVYEASSRSGGRMYSAKGVAAPEVTTELGGEFVDTGHREILGIARRFGLSLIDTVASTEKGLHPEAFLLGGQTRRPEEIAAEFRALSPRLRADVQTSRRPGWERFDRLSLADYLDSLGLRSGWLRAALAVAYRTEYGLDIEEQSAMNMLSLLQPRLVRGRIRFFGDSDERYKILGGNQRVADSVADEVRDQIRIGCSLEALTPAASGNGYRLHFAPGTSGPREVDADIVILAVPFTILRRLDVRVPLPPSKQKAITELGYGMNAKMFYGFSRRLWREQGYAGALFTDTDCQLVWDSSRLQPTTQGALTMLTGGQAGVQIGREAPTALEARLLPHVERVWPGVTALRLGAPGRFHWPTHPQTLAAYACYRVGQWSSLRGQEGTPVDQLYFAGEHCSLEAQGYMEGGAQTGKAVAQNILARLRG